MDFQSFSYLFLNLICCVFIIYIGFKSLDSEDHSTKSKTKIKLVLGLMLWQFFIFLVSKSGYTLTLSFPPRFAILFIIPSFLFTGIFLYSNRNKNWIKTLPIQKITLFQSFRIAVESLFLWSVADGILHKNVTLEGYNYDMIFAISAILIYGYIFKLKKGSNTLLKVWNYLGLAVLASVIFVFISTLYLPEIYGFSETPMKVSFLEYPYILVAAFMMPLAVFLHVLSIIHLNKVKESLDMKAATVREIKQELAGLNQTELIDLVLRLSKFKKDNKELLTYLLYEAENESAYILSIKDEVDFLFSEINLSSYYLMKKTIRKILRQTKKYIRYSQNKATEAELLIYFCLKLKELKPPISSNTVLSNLYIRQKQLAQKAIESLHEDLQFDFKSSLEKL